MEVIMDGLEEDGAQHGPRLGALIAVLVDEGALLEQEVLAGLLQLEVGWKLYSLLAHAGSGCLHLSILQDTQTSVSRNMQVDCFTAAKLVWLLLTQDQSAEEDEAHLGPFAGWQQALAPGAPHASSLLSHPFWHKLLMRILAETGLKPVGEERGVVAGDGQCCLKIISQGLSLSPQPCAKLITIFEPA